MMSENKISLQVSWGDGARPIKPVSENIGHLVKEISLTEALLICNGESLYLRNQNGQLLALEIQSYSTVIDTGKVKSISLATKVTKDELNNPFWSSCLEHNGFKEMPSST